MMESVLIFSFKDCCPNLFLQHTIPLYFQFSIMKQLSNHHIFPSFLSRGLLLVLVVKAENLPPRKDGECVDPFVDVQLLPYYKRRMHSEVHQKTQNPAFNQCFEFEVPPYEIREQQIQFTVLDFSQQLDHSTIGTVVFDIISLDNDALRAGKEFSLWKRIDKVGIHLLFQFVITVNKQVH